MYMHHCGKARGLQTPACSVFPRQPAKLAQAKCRGVRQRANCDFPPTRFVYDGRVHGFPCALTCLRCKTGALPRVIYNPGNVTARGAARWTSHPRLGLSKLLAAPRVNASSADVATTPAIFQRVEQLIVTNFNRDSPGGRLDWQQIEECWVLKPSAKVGKAQAVAVFLGGPFVGAVPELSYRLFLESMAARNILVVAVPYATQFDLQRTADEIQDRFTSCMEKIGSEVRGLPVYGIGHSTGALLTLLINSRFAVRCDGNILLSYNNRPAQDIVPFLAPFVAPSARAVGPLLSQAASNPIGMSVASLYENAKMMAPSLVKMGLPAFEQISPVFMDVAHGRHEWTPSPEEAAELIQSYYSAPRTMLMRFADDDIDETSRLAAMLQKSGATSTDLTLRTLPGNHIRPLVQNWVDVPTPIAHFASNTIRSSGTVLGSLSSVAKDAGLFEVEGGLKQAGRQVERAAGILGGTTGGPITDSVTMLGDEIAAWMGVGGVFVSGGNPRALPEKTQG